MARNAPSVLLQVLEKGAKGLNAVMLSSAGGHVGVTRILLAAAADVNATDARWRTALLLAAEKGRRDVRGGRAIAPSW